MPRVTLQFENGRSQTETGGCFGFTGRGGDCRDRSYDHSGQPITNYIVDLGYQINGQPIRKGVFDMWKYLATESPYAKYVNRLVEGNDDGRGWAVEIKTDIPGHAVIGTATVFRFVAYMNNESGSAPEVFKHAVDLGSNKTIAFMLAAMVFRNRSKFISGQRSMITGNGNYAQNLVRYPDLGDDTPLDFSTIDRSDLASYIKGDWEFKQNDQNPYPLYKDSGSYREEILNSYRTGNFNFVQYVQCRFFPTSTIIAPRSAGGGGLGRSTNNNLTVIDTNCIEPLSLVGVAIQLTAEYNKYGSFKNLNLHNGV